MIDTDSREKVYMQLANGTAADIIMMFPDWLPTLADSSDFLVDMNTQDIVDLSGFDETAMKSIGEFDGKLIGIPSSYSTITMCMNLTACEAYGVTPYDEWTVEEFYAIGEQLHMDYPEVYLYNVAEQEIYEFARMLLKEKISNNLFSDDYQMNFTEQDFADVLAMIKDGYDRGVYQPLAEAVSTSPDGACLLNPIWLLAMHLVFPVPPAVLSMPLCSLKAAMIKTSACSRCRS